MSYKVLYRKYRPDDFSTLVGQENIVRILKNSVDNNKLSHAYIFSGPRGTGKTSSAKIFAKCVNCLSLENGNPCNKCENCLNYENSNDIIEIDAASNNGVDEMREIINNIKLSPNFLKYKVYIVDEVHMLSQSAFNALLLTLEEPPSHVIFILATTNIESVPITIMSRCQRFDFKKIDLNVIVRRINDICKEENIEITEDAAIEIARVSDGGMRDSLSLLDQLSKSNQKIDLNMVTDSVGNISLKSINLILDAIEDNDFSKVIDLLDEFSLKSVDYKLLIKGLIDQSALRVKNMLINNKQDRLSTSDYKKLVFDLTDCMNKINVNVNVYSLLTVLLMTYMDTKNIVIAESSVVKNVEANASLNKKIDDSSVLVLDKDADFNKNFDEIKKIRVNNCFVNVSKDEKNKQLQNWGNFKDDVSKQLRGIVVDSDVAMASKEIIVIHSSSVNDVEELFNNIDNIEEQFNKLNKSLFKFVFLTSDEWKNLSSDYVKNIKNGVKYNYIEEKNEKIDELSAIASDIFDSAIIEEG